MGFTVLKLRAVYLLLIALLCSGYTLCAQSGQPHPVHWINVVGATSNGTSLTKTHPHATWVSTGAVSSNILEAGLNGWLEFTASNGNYIIGFAAGNIIDIDEFTHAVMVSPGSYTIYEGATAVASGTRLATDVFSIFRDGTAMKYYKNEVEVRSINTGSGFLRVNASIAGGSAPLVFASFDAQVIVQGAPTATEGAQTGGISLSVSGAKSPYTFLWDDEEGSASSISSRPRGTYSVTVTDALGRTKRHSYFVGYKVNWINTMNVSISGSRLTKTHPHATWVTSGAISSNILLPNADGWIEFPVGVVGGQIIGLATTNRIDLTEFVAGVEINYLDNSYAIREGSANPTSGKWQIGDVFRISLKFTTTRTEKLSMT